MQQSYQPPCFAEFDGLTVPFRGVVSVKVVGGPGGGLVLVVAARGGPGGPGGILKVGDLDPGGFFEMVSTTTISDVFSAR